MLSFIVQYKPHVKHLAPLNNNVFVEFQYHLKKKNYFCLKFAYPVLDCVSSRLAYRHEY